MTVTNQDEYKLSNGQTISIQLNENQWEVACWNEDDTCHWYKEFNDEAEAKKEFNAWKK